MPPLLVRTTSNSIAVGQSQVQVHVVPSTNRLPATSAATHWEATPGSPYIDVAIPLIFLWVRKLLNLTQGDVAEKIGVSQQAYRKLEIPGKSNPTLKTVTKLIEALELPPTLISSIH